VADLQSRKVFYNEKVNGTSQAVTIPAESKGNIIGGLISKKYGTSIGEDSIGLTVQVANAPKAPSNLKATNIEKTTATLTWTDNSTNETGFKIYQGTKLVQIVAANVKSYNLTGLKANTTYAYSVKAYNIAGLSLATSTKFKTKKEVNATKSTITSPLNGSTVEAGKSLTVNWKNNAATKEFLYITSYLNFRT
jgi:hypothetical protein